MIYRDLLVEGPTVLLGDFNSSVALDDRLGRSDHRTLDTQLRDEFGLVSAYHVSHHEQAGSESRPTHYWRWQETSPYHLDYCYLPQSWVSSIESVAVGSYPVWADASDHRPLIVDVSPPLP
jgi:endonuclease/exonuclease/phosphatase family metal-dependent hydrolase